MCCGTGINTQLHADCREIFSNPFIYFYTYRAIKSGKKLHMREVFWKIILNEWNDPKVKGVCKVKKNIIFWHLCCTFVIFASIFLFLYSTVFTMYYYICMITLTEKSQETVVWVGSTKIGFWQFYLLIFFLT